ncbi:MAG: hypothetical protein EOP51_13800 [Sphingobacteriales bacterium]|nr:MAG: hypothetical protein EOP51_13800 [Sphingobacteriales bacterium]
MKLFKKCILLAVSAFSIASCKKTEPVIQSQNDNQTDHTQKELFAQGCIPYKGTVQIPNAALNMHDATDLKIDKAGNLYLTATGNQNTITKYNAAGTLQWTTNFNAAKIDIDAQGRIYGIAQADDYNINGLPGYFRTATCAVLNSGGTYIKNGVIAKVVNRKGNTYTDMNVDEAGNMYLIGLYDAGYSQGTFGQPDKDLPGSGFVFQKWSPTGALLINNLSLKTSLKGLEKLNALYLTGDGGFIVIGQARVGSTTYVVVAKYNSNIQQVWLKVTPDGISASINSYSKIFTDKSATGDMYVYLTTNTRSVLSKFNNTGNLIWSKELSPEALIERKDMAVGPAGSVYFTGTYTGNPDFDPGAGAYRLKDATNDGQAQMFIEKYSVAGNFAGATGFYNSVSSIYYQSSSTIAVDKNNNIVHAGSFTGTMDFDPTTGVKNIAPTNGANIFVNVLSECE